MTKKHGFGLLALLITIAVIGIGAWVVVKSLNKNVGVTVPDTATTTVSGAIDQARNAVNQVEQQNQMESGDTNTTSQANSTEVSDLKWKIMKLLFSEDINRLSNVTGFLPDEKKRDRFYYIQMEQGISRIHQENLRDYQNMPIDVLYATYYRKLAKDFELTLYRENVSPNVGYTSSLKFAGLDDNNKLVFYREDELINGPSKSPGPCRPTISSEYPRQLYYIDLNVTNQASSHFDLTCNQYIQDESKCYNAEKKPYVFAGSNLEKKIQDQVKECRRMNPDV